MIVHLNDDHRWIARADRRLARTSADRGPSESIPAAGLIDQADLKVQPYDALR